MISDLSIPPTIRRASGVDVRRRIASSARQGESEKSRMEMEGVPMTWMTNILLEIGGVRQPEMGPWAAAVIHKMVREPHLCWEHIWMDHHG